MMSWDGWESFDAVGERRRERLGDMLDIMAEWDDNGCQKIGNSKTKVISFYLARRRALRNLRAIRAEAES